MDTNQPASSTTTTTTTSAPVSAAPGMFGTKIPSSVAFAVGILLFFLPFSEIRCGGSPFMNQTGKGFILNENWKPTGTAGMLGNDSMKESTSKVTGEKAGNSQIFAIAAAGLALLGFLLSFANAKTGGGGGMVTGILSAGALIALMFDVKKWFNDGLAKEALDKTKEGADNIGLDKIGNTMGDMKPTLAFTPWFYVAVIAFLAAAFFCYKRMQTSKN
ncbi:MAG TPA: hypothetical protein VK483_17295 [Chitinophagaceae bacterium]|nr:hypothetical protein [Chitinophagaceae bacterium]